MESYVIRPVRFFGKCIVLLPKSFYFCHAYYVSVIILENSSVAQLVRAADC